ncbi:PNPLA8 [Mytilus edulis]|uniref:PNPLA8 n=1 Tax=Mytilus edulis TaxID=6550 RepID=A0A8S3S252_MYTED|nr:PNPLA8 [Mytilus edulis]
MAVAYRNSLIRTRLFDGQGCSSQKWIHTTDNRESSNLQTIKRNYSGSDGDGGTNSKGDNSHPVTKIKNNVSWMMNSIKVPQITIPDWRKFAPEEMNFTESVRKNKDKIVDSLVLKKQQFKKFQMTKKQNIVSFYDTSNLNGESQTVIKVKVNEEDIPPVLKADSKVDEAWLSRIVGLGFFSSAPTSEAQDSKPVVRKDFVSKASIDSRTKAMVHNLKQASSQVSKLKRTEDLCTHLIQLPNSRTTAMKRGHSNTNIKDDPGTVKVPLAEAEERYMEFSQMFNRNAGMAQVNWFQAFVYDTDLLEKILKMNFSEDKMMADCAKDDTCPKVSVIYCLLNVPKMKSFMFHSYNLPPECIPIILDGGLMANNPAAIAVSECKLLWPDEPIQCVISLGNGRFEPNLEITPSKNAVKEKVAKIIDAATNTEVVHTILQDLLPTSTYYRFNPYMSEDIRLDEKRTEKLIQMQQDTEMYLRKNEFKLKCATEQLLKQRQPHQQVLDYIKLKADSSFLADSKIL